MNMFTSLAAYMLEMCEQATKVLIVLHIASEREDNGHIFLEGRGRSPFPFREVTAAAAAAAAGGPCCDLKQKHTHSVGLTQDDLKVPMFELV